MPRPKIPEDEKKRRLVERHVRAIVECLSEGEDPRDRVRLDLDRTPSRVARMLVDETLSYPPLPEPHLTDIPPGYGDILAQGPIGVASTCAHHLLPFTGHAWVSYLADRHWLGLSKFTRVVRALSRRLQLQERLTHQIRDTLVTMVQPQAILVVLRCGHGCMSCRGVGEPDIVTVTSSLYPTDMSMIEDRVLREMYDVIGMTRGLKP